MNRECSRRQTVAALGGVAAAPAAGRGAAAGHDSYDAAIIGAGLAGLNAAMILTELGAKVVVLEADTHSGGRCLTMDRWFLTPDLGGAQIGRDYARVIDVANRLNVRLGPGAHINAPNSFVLGGTPVPAGQWASSTLNRTVGPERSIAPHALGGYYVEGRTPFKTLTAGWPTMPPPTMSRWRPGWITLALRAKRVASFGYRKAVPWRNSRCCA